MIKLVTTHKNPIEIPEGSASARINAAKDKFRKDAGDMIVSTLQEILGNESELGFTLQPGYSERKQKDKRLRRVVGKSSDQPLILSREGIYDALEVVEDGDGFIVQIKEGLGVSDNGFDYAMYWLEQTGLMERAMMKVRDELNYLMEFAILSEVGL